MDVKPGDAVWFPREWVPAGADLGDDDPTDPRAAGIVIRQGSIMGVRYGHGDHDWFAVDNHDGAMIEL